MLNNMENIFPPNVCDNISSFIQRDSDCFSPTASIVRDMLKNSKKGFLLRLILNSDIKMRIVEVERQWDQSVITIDLELTTDTPLLDLGLMTN